MINKENLKMFILNNKKKIILIFLSIILFILYIIYNVFYISMNDIKYINNNYLEKLNSKIKEEWYNIELKREDLIIIDLYRKNGLIFIDDNLYYKWKDWDFSYREKRALYLKWITIWN